MLNIPLSVKTLFEQDRVRKNFRARFPNGELPDITNKDVVQESVRFTESICSQDVLKFGLTEASVIEFETVGVANMYGMTIECFCEIDVSGLADYQLESVRKHTGDGELIELSDSDLDYPFYRVPYGVFLVESCPRNQDAMAHRQVTAYSPNFSKLSKNIPLLPQDLPWPVMLIDPLAFYAQATGEGLKELETQSASDYINSANIYLYDATKKAYCIRLYKDDGYSVFAKGISTNMAEASADFIKADISYDAEAYYAAGKSIANALTAAGYDLTYDTTGKKNYSSNEQALAAVAPYLFAPSLTGGMRAWIGASGVSDYINAPYSQKIKSGVLHPVINMKTRLNNSLVENAAFTPQSTATPGWPNGDLVYVTSEAVAFRLFDNNFNQLMESEAAYPEVTVNEVKLYRLASYSAFSVKVISSGASTFNYPTQFNNKNQTLPLYSYADAYDREALLDGQLELSAMFGKVNRRGELVGLRLSTDNPIGIQPEKYSSLWWDEFDVAPIGSVQFNYMEEDEQKTSVFVFGSGASVYDLSDNAVINSLEGASLEEIQGLLQQYFIPHLLPVAFTPIELNMQGLPYIEDGDYLSVVAADGTEAFSFNMRHELSGIQLLEAEVTSVSGQIIDSEVVT